MDHIKEKNKLLIKLSLREVGTEKGAFNHSYLIRVGIQPCLTPIVKAHAFGRSTPSSGDLKTCSFFPNKLSHFSPSQGPHSPFSVRPLSQILSKAGVCLYTGCVRAGEEDGRAREPAGLELQGLERILGWLLPPPKP